MRLKSLGRALALLLAVLILATAVPALAAPADNVPTRIWINPREVDKQELVPLDMVTTALKANPDLEAELNYLYYIDGEWYIPVWALAAGLDAQVSWDAARHQLVIWRQVGNTGNPVKKDPRDVLQYYTYYDRQARDQVLVVSNPTNRPVTLQFASAQTHDFVVTRNGRTVWQASAGKDFAQVWRQEILEPGASRVYRSRLPRLAAGTYQVKAYFKGGKTTGPVASTTLKIDRWQSPLYYGLSYGDGRLRFSIENPTGETVRQVYSTAATFDIEVQGDNAYTWRYSDGKTYRPWLHVNEMGPGAASYKFIYLPDLPAGRYVANAYDLAVSSTQPVASTVFYVY
ncbi:MAG: hypothetical protein D9V47_06970 [Clostridia bacterium]|nr:MAG: hypothetical protein D9V47_06970 [Clostridia bacterium]